MSSTKVDLGNSEPANDDFRTDGWCGTWHGTGPCQYYVYNSYRSGFAVFSCFGVGTLFSLLAVNAVFCIFSVNSFMSILSWVSSKCWWMNEWFDSGIVYHIPGNSSPEYILFFDCRIIITHWPSSRVLLASLHVPRVHVFPSWVQAHSCLLDATMAISKYVFEETASVDIHVVCRMMQRTIVLCSKFWIDIFRYCLSNATL